MEVDLEQKPPTPCLSGRSRMSAPPTSHSTSLIRL